MYIERVAEEPLPREEGGRGVCMSVVTVFLCLYECAYCVPLSECVFCVPYGTDISTVTVFLTGQT